MKAKKKDIVAGRWCRVWYSDTGCQDGLIVDVGEWVRVYLLNDRAATRVSFDQIVEVGKFVEPKCTGLSCYPEDRP